MVGNVESLRELFSSFVGLGPGIMDLEDCAILFSHSPRREVVTEKYLLRCPQGLSSPGPETPADGRTKHNHDVAPLRALWKEGACFPGIIRLLRGVATFKPAWRSALASRE